MKKMYLLLVILCISLQSLYSVEFDKSKLPKLLGASNMGREFYFSFIPAWEYGDHPYIKIYISSNIKTKVTVEVIDKGYSKTKFTVPNDIIEFTLYSVFAQPTSKGPSNPPEPDRIYRGAGVHVFADDPIICYGVTRFDYTSGGFLAIPVNSLGKEYIISSYPDVAKNVSQWLPSEFTVTAPYDKTEILFTMGGTDWSKTAGGQLPEETTKWKLNAGDVLLVSSLGHLADLTGSKIEASKPVAVVSGNYCAYVPTNCGCCDLLEEMELPTEIWGTQYHVTPIINRLKNSIIRIFAKEPKTNVYRDNDFIGTIKTAGGLSGTGWLDMRVDTGKPRPITIHSDKPIGVTQYNTSKLDDSTESKPFQMVLVPTEQYQTDITFNTPGIRGGYGFLDNYINICYESDSIGTIPDDLEIAHFEQKDSMFKWTKISGAFDTLGRTFTNILKEELYSMLTYKLLGDGVYKLRANKPFQVYSYGFSLLDSYGFPASIALKKQDRVDSLPPAPEWKMDCQGNVNKDRTRLVTDKPDLLAPCAKLSMIYMSSDLSYNYKLYYSEFMPCEDISTTWRLETIDPTEDAKAVVTFADCNGNDSTVVIEYNAPDIKISEKFFNFESHSVSSVSWHEFHLINYGTAAWECTRLKLKKKDELSIDQGFEIFNEYKTDKINLPVTIQAGDSLHFWVKFSPTLEGTFWDSIGFGDTCFFFYKSYVNAAVGMPIIDVSDWNFPATNVGSPAYGQFDVKNIGSVDLEITGYEGPFVDGKVFPAKIYKADDLEAHNISETNKLVIAPGKTVGFALTFTPDDTISYPDEIRFISNTIKTYPAGDPTLVDSVCLLSGRGLQSDLIATSYNWERKRIHRTAFPVGPYPATINAVNADTCIKLFNGGNTPVTILRIIDVSKTGDITAFKINKADLINKEIAGMDSLIVQVEFQPTATGNHVYTFEFEANNPTTKGVQTTLMGIGIVPRISTKDIELSSELYDYLHPNLKNIVVKNISSKDWSFGDSVLINDLIFNNINTDLNLGWGSFPESFRIDKSALRFPILMHQGDSLVIPVIFVARGKNPVTATITTVSDAEFEVTANLSGSIAEPGAVNEFVKDINLYPNPTEDILIIDKLPINTSKIQIFDESGKEVRTIDIKNQSESFKISTKDLPIGNYILRLYVGGEVLDRKFVVVR